MKPRDLQRLHDGEVDADEAAELKRKLSPEDRGRLEALEEVGHAVRSEIEARVMGAPPIDVWASIESRLDDDKMSDVSVLPDRSASRPSKRRFFWASGLTLASAAAAVLVMVFLSPGAASGASVESVDFGDQSGILFQLPETGTTVIWQYGGDDDL